MSRFGWQAGIARGAVVLLAGCGAPLAASDPAPVLYPQPVTGFIPPRPIPPDHAPSVLAVPPLNARGQRVSVNRNITPAQSVWNLRSAYNVAALNCRGPEHAEIVPNYRQFLRANAAVLKRINDRVDGQFRRKYGDGFVVPRESYMTEVYNHFALPPTMAEFCRVVQSVSHEGLKVRPARLEVFAQRRLAMIEVVFDDFYRRYEAYRVALADWTARYGAAADLAVPAVAAASIGPRRD